MPPKGYSQLEGGGGDGPKAAKKKSSLPKGGEIVGDGSACSELPGMWAIAWPTMIAALMRSGTQQVTMILVGHLGVNELGAIAMGNMWVSVTGMMIVFGGMGALDTLAAQAYGAKNFPLVGLWTQRAIVLVFFVNIPLSLLWFYSTKPGLEAMAINSEIATLAQDFTRVQCLWALPMFW
eukprot:COSAG04_NODE_77_length_28411_cov_8.599181_19_plen_179_part_00